MIRRLRSAALFPALAIVFAVVIGAGVAVGSSPASLTRSWSRATGSAPSVDATSRFRSTPLPSPTPPLGPPTPAGPGQLGKEARLSVIEGGVLLASAGAGRLKSADGGATWSALKLPAGAAAVAVDPRDSKHMVAGGSAVASSDDAGASWKPTRAPPPLPAQYRPLAVSPNDSEVWFLLHGEKLLRTRDASISWRDLDTLPPLNSPVMVAGPAAGQFFISSGGRVLELEDNGQRIQDRGALLAGAGVLELAVVAAGNPAELLARGSDGNSYMFKAGQWAQTMAQLGGPVSALPNGGMIVGDGGFKLGSPGAVALSADGGASWMRGTGLPRDQSVEALAVTAGADPKVYAYCFGGDLYSSSDGGRMWALLNSELRSPG